MEVVFPALEVVSKREHLSCGKPCHSPHTRLQQTNKPIISTRIFLLPRPNRSSYSSLLPHPPSLIQELGTALPPDPPWSSGSLGPKYTPEPNHQHLTSYSFKSSQNPLPPPHHHDNTPSTPYIQHGSPRALRQTLIYPPSRSHQSHSLHKDLTKAAPSTLRLYPKRHASTPHPLRDTLLQHPGGFVAHHVPRRKEPSLSFLLPPHASHPVPSAQLGSPDT